MTAKHLITPVIRSASEEALALAQTLGSYEPVAITGLKVEEWLARFKMNPTLKAPFLEALNVMFQSTYVELDTIVAFLRKVVRRRWVPKGHTAVFFYGHFAGKSTEVFRALMQEIVEEEGLPPLVWFGENEPDFGKKVYAYVDDFFCTGNTFVSAVRTLPRSAQQSKIFGLFLHLYQGNKAYSLTQLSNHGYHHVHILQTHSDESMVLWPRNQEEYDKCPKVRKIASDHTKYGFHWRRKEICNDRIFQGSQSCRNLVEYFLFMEGVRMWEQPYTVWPMGHQALTGLGLGASSVSYRNCPNNAPPALWLARYPYPALVERLRPK